MNNYLKKLIQQLSSTWAKLKKQLVKPKKPDLIEQVSRLLILKEQKEKLNLEKLNEQHLSTLQQIELFLKKEFEKHKEAIETGQLPEKCVEGGGLLFAAITGKEEHIKNFLTKLPGQITGKEAPISISADGSVWGTDKYQHLDIGWTEALTTLFENLPKYPFITFPEHDSSYKNIAMDSSTTIAVIGDWGSGYWKSNSPPEAVASVANQMKADYVIHLGDVYYSGSPEEERVHLTDIMPQGKKGTFSLNSNHEMYSLAQPYFKAISNPPFGFQFGASYFAMENDNWIIVCLDTAFFSSAHHLFLEGSIGDSENPTQINFLTDLATRAQNNNKDLIIMSHHNGFEGAGLKVKTPIWEEITGILNGIVTDRRIFWHWGHAHSGYSCNLVDNIYGRCIGHSAMPWGKGSDFFIGSGSNLNWFEDKTQPEDGSTLLMNGLLKLELDGSTITETFYDQTGAESAKLVDGVLQSPVNS